VSARWLLIAGAAALWLAACNAKLPEPESAGAKLYASRCNSCHRIYAPGLMKYEMWKFQVDRMQGEMVRHGLPPLTEQERTVVLDYLKRHSG
jgi:cytochrome c5